MLAGSLPEAVRNHTGSALGAVTGDGLRIRRALVEENLRQAFPDRDEAWRERVARDSYRHLGREALTILALGARSAAEIRERTPITGWDRLRAAIDRGKGVVMATAHFGNWELGGASLAVRGVGVDAIVQRQSNPLVDRDIVSVREALGVRVIDRRHAAKRVLGSLREGRVIGFVADQDARRSGVFVPFFGRPASTHRGPALFAIRSGAPLFLGVAPRGADGTYHCRVHEIEADRSGPLEEAIVRLTAAFTRKLEEEIRLAPEQYFWLHRRWKTRPAADTQGAAGG